MSSKSPSATLKDAIAKKESEVDALDRDLEGLRESVRRAEAKQAAEAAKLTYLKLYSVATPEAVSLADEVGQAVHAFDASLKPTALRHTYSTAKGATIQPPAVVADSEIGYQYMDDYGDTNGVEATLEAALDAVSSYRDANPKETSNAISMLLLVTEAFLPLCLASHSTLASRAKGLSVDPAFIAFGAQVRTQLGFSFGAGAGSSDLMCGVSSPTASWATSAEHDEYLSTRGEVLSCSAFDEMVSSVLDEWAQCIIAWVTHNHNAGTCPEPAKCVSESEVLLQLVEQLLGPDARASTTTKIDAAVREILDM